jgi:hypothetical protein
MHSGDKAIGKRDLGRMLVPKGCVEVVRLVSFLGTHGNRMKLAGDDRALRKGWQSHLYPTEDLRTRDAIDGAFTSDDRDEPPTAAPAQP